MRSQTAAAPSSSEASSPDRRYSTGRDGATRRRRPAPPVDLIAGDTDPAIVLAGWQTVRIRTALGIALRQTSRVVEHRPRWMPGRLYRALMRSIVIEVDDVNGRPVLASLTSDHRSRRA